MCNVTGNYFELCAAKPHLDSCESVLTETLNERLGAARITKVVVGIDVLPTRSLFGGGILRRMLPRAL